MPSFLFMLPMHETYSKVASYMFDCMGAHYSQSTAVGRQSKELPMSRLQGKRTLITGGTSGIGLETAKQFLAEGARVIVTGVNPDSIAKAQAELGSEVP